MYQQRSSYPSQAQIEALMDFLEENPRLASGVPTAPSARDRTRKLWEKQAYHLNSLGGSIKSRSQWRKYWADKRNAVRKKAAQRLAERNKHGDRLPEILELTDTEERILRLMGGDSYETPEKHYGYNGHQNVSSSPPPEMTLTTTVNIKEEATEYESMEEGQAASVLSVSLIEQADPTLPLAETPSSFSNPNPHVNHSISREPSPTFHAPRPPRNTNPRRTRRMTQMAAMSPPTQRRSQFVSLTERFLRVEENRLEMDRRYATIIENLLERDVERDRTITQALSSLGDSLKLIADALNK